MVPIGETEKYYEAKRYLTNGRSCEADDAEEAVCAFLDFSLSFFRGMCS